MDYSTNERERKGQSAKESAKSRKPFRCARIGWREEKQRGDPDAALDGTAAAGGWAGAAGAAAVHRIGSGEFYRSGPVFPGLAGGGAGTDGPGVPGTGGLSWGDFHPGFRGTAQKTDRPH